MAYTPNLPQTIVAFLAAQSIGAIWSSCSPDFGTASVVDRFAQIEPKVLIASSTYSYNGKSKDKKQDVEEIISQIPSIKHVVAIDDTFYDVAVGQKKWSEIKDKSLFRGKWKAIHYCSIFKDTVKYKKNKQAE